MRELIAGGEAALQALRTLVSWAEARGEAAWRVTAADAPFLTPVEPRSCFAAGRNFDKHRAESIAGNPGIVGANFHVEFPTGFIKLGRVRVPHRTEVARPAGVMLFDYEIEPAVVLSERLHDADRATAARAIFGYTIFNDLSAREWQLAEMKNQLLMLGKNFPGFGPIGPYVVTADEIPDARRLALRLDVNGGVRQESLCDDMIFCFDELVSFWSRMGLEPGDVVTGGTPEGVALRRKPDPAPFYLKPGDVVHATIDQIGTLETTIV
ncbi:fumarylacetoacetate hydrolase family protein [soil metagenome]